jgi:hypothetical protein
MRRPRGARGEGRLGCIIWLIIVSIVGYGLYMFVPVKMASARFEDFMAEEAGFASIRGVREIERNILTKAKDLELPITKDNLTITKSREKIKVEAHYEIVIELFGGNYKYVWKFDPVIERPLFLV